MEVVYTETENTLEQNQMVMMQQGKKSKITSSGNELCIKKQEN